MLANAAAPLISDNDIRLLVPLSDFALLVAVFLLGAVLFLAVVVCLVVLVAASLVLPVVSLVLLPAVVVTYLLQALRLAEVLLLDVLDFY
jgi:hypothetical protein